MSGKEVVPANDSKEAPAAAGGGFLVWLKTSSWKLKIGALLGIGAIVGIITACVMFRGISGQTSCLIDPSEEEEDSDNEEEKVKHEQERLREESRIIHDDDNRIMQSADAANNIWCYHTHWKPLMKRPYSQNWHYFYSHQRQYFKKEILSPETPDLVHVSTFFRLMSKSLRMLAYLDDKEQFLVRSKSHEVSLASGDFLFKHGDINDKMYFVQSGSIRLRIQVEGKSHTLHTFNAGGAICSSLSLINVLTNRETYFHTIEADAAENSVVISTSLGILKEIWSHKPQYLVIAVKTQFHRFFQLCFVALHIVLGLGMELFENTPIKNTWTHGSLEVTPELKMLALEGLKQKMGIETDDDILDGCEVLIFDEGSTLVETSSPKSRDTFFIRHGDIEVATVSDEGEKEILFNCGENEFIGSFQTLTDEESIFTITAVQKSLVVLIHEDILDMILLKHPETAACLMEAITTRLSPFALQLDFAIQWGFYKYSELVYNSGDFPDATYLVLTGRLRSLIFDLISGKPRIFGEYGTHDWIGLVEVLTGRSRTKAVMAVRDTELAIIPNGVLKMINNQYPVVTNKLLEFLGERMAKSAHIEGHGHGSQHSNVPTCLKNRNGSYWVKEEHLAWDKGALVSSAIALIPLNEGVPIEIFGNRLVKYFNQITPENESAIVLKKDDFITKLDIHWTEKDLLYTTSWLSKLERKYSQIFFLGDMIPSEWNAKFLKNVDAILFLAMSDDPVRSTREIENTISSYAPIARKELVLFHKPTKNFRGSTVPIRTKSWLRRRPWLSMHHHIHLDEFLDPRATRDPDLYNMSMPMPNPNRPSVVQTDEEQQFPSGPPSSGPSSGPPSSTDSTDSFLISKSSQTARISRWLSGNSTGFVFGGSGARGAAHIGILENVISNDIPIDMVGGVGVGGLVAAFFAIFCNIEKVKDETVTFFKKRNDGWITLWDLLIPYIAAYRGKILNELLKETFENVQLEDLWIPFFCVTTDLTTSKARIHRCGSIWRYIRATMNKASYYPPVCDPIDGHWLMSGEYIKIVPADTMKYHMGARFIIAIDISREKEVNVANYGDHVSGISVLFHKYAPFVEPLRIPTAIGILELLGLVQSAINSEITKSRDSSTIYIHPPVSQFSHNDYTRFYEIKDVSFNYGKDILFKDCAPRINETTGEIINYTVPELWFRINCANIDAEEKGKSRHKSYIISSTG